MPLSKGKFEKCVEPRVLDIFCGAGGMSLGFQNAGCKILGGIDQNRYAIHTHHRNFPDTKLKLSHQDIRQVKFDDLGIDVKEVDILIGGPPCQVYSRVGIGKMRKLGFDVESDERNFLYKEFVRFVRYYNPLCFVMENVDNLANKQDVISKICRELEGKNSDNSSYKTSFRILDSSRFGIPQKRKRLFIVGIRDDLDIEPTFPVENFDGLISVGEAISDLPEIKPHIMPLKTKSSGPKQQDREVAYESLPQSSYQEKMRRNKEKGVWNHLCRSHNEKDILIFEILSQGEKYKDLPIDLMRYRVDIFDDKYKRLVWDEPSWTLTAHMKKDGLAYIHPLQARSISVREAARIQSFPDDFVFDAPMTRMFELVGNSVPPMLAEAVAHPLVKIVQTYYESHSHALRRYYE